MIIYGIIHIACAFMTMAIVAKMDGFVTLGCFAWSLITGPIGFGLVLVCQSCVSDEIILWRKS